MAAALAAAAAVAAASAAEYHSCAPAFQRPAHPLKAEPVPGLATGVEVASRAGRGSAGRVSSTERHTSRQCKGTGALSPAAPALHRARRARCAAHTDELGLLTTLPPWRPMVRRPRLGWWPSPQPRTARRASPPRRPAPPSNTGAERRTRVEHGRVRRVGGNQFRRSAHVCVCGSQCGACLSADAGVVWRCASGAPDAALGARQPI